MEKYKKASHGSEKNEEQGVIDKVNYLDFKVTDLGPMRARTMTKKGKRDGSVGGQRKEVQS